jgi:hypothetical protein
MTDPFRELTQEVQTRTCELACLMWETAGRQQGMALDYWIKFENEVFSILQATAARMMPSTKAANKDNNEAKPNPEANDSDIALDMALAAAPPPRSADVEDFAPPKAVVVEAEALARAGAKRRRKAPAHAKHKA